MRTLFLAFVLITIASSSVVTHANPNNIGNIKASKALIDTICSRTTNPSLCFKVLNADPRTPGASLKDLGQISLDLATPHAKTTHTFIQSLVQKATDPKLKVQLNSCLRNYNEAIKDLDEGRKALNSGNPRGLNSYASAAYAASESCDEGFLGKSLPEPQEIKQANQKLRDLSSITIVVSAFLLIPPSH
ncbi:hypothetical protein ACH5RR_041389 [Cinchona calisaya]|uniref:Pectinesterase inhibitor domain-containing protein n=1 Tax=Cinchona calisaya TaxID=153742 RepID=A0ABD2XTK7_9GENT